MAYLIVADGLNGLGNTEMSNPSGIVLAVLATWVMIVLPARMTFESLELMMAVENSVQPMLSVSVASEPQSTQGPPVTNDHWRSILPV